MAVVLFKEGSSKVVKGVRCDVTIIDRDLDHALKNGWHLSVDELYKKEEPEQNENPDIPEQYDDTDIDDEDALRQKARDLGIKSWHVKSIENIKKEIEEIENGGSSEVGLD